MVSDFLSNSPKHAAGFVRHNKLSYKLPRNYDAHHSAFVCQSQAQIIKRIVLERASDVKTIPDVKCNVNVKTINLLVAAYYAF